MKRIVSLLLVVSMLIHPVVSFAHETTSEQTPTVVRSAIDYPILIVQRFFEPFGDVRFFEPFGDVHFLVCFL